MNELKAEDVMRALECCIEVDCGSIAICPRRENYKNEYICSANLKKDALALLREKNAEIERLNKERDDARWDCAVAEQNHYECKKELETARAEAITEFSEKLKEAAYGDCTITGYKHYIVDVADIDEIAEELKGELKMANKQRQKNLDKKKWLESQEQGFDMSGCMLYCAKCEYADHTHPTENGKCYAPHEKRVAECLCAKAYNRMMRG